MKNFNKVITIEIEANQIAQMLLAQMNPEFKHSELVVEAVIGSSTDVSLGMLYNSLNGYSPEIDFEIGDEINPALRIYGYWTVESREVNDTVYGDVTKATVIEIDLFSNNKLKIEYQVPGKDGLLKREAKWVRHTSCNKISPSIDLKKKPVINEITA
jgi:hypothetical protein